MDAVDRGICRKLEQRNGSRHRAWRKQAHKSLSGPTGPRAKKRSPLIGRFATSGTNNGGRQLVKIEVPHN